MMEELPSLRKFQDVSLGSYHSYPENHENHHHAPMVFFMLPHGILWPRHRVRPLVNHSEIQNLNAVIAAGGLPQSVSGRGSQRENISAKGRKALDFPVVHFDQNTICCYRDLQSTVPQDTQCSSYDIH